MAEQPEPIQRVDALVEQCMSEVGQPPSTVIVKPETWDWFAEEATRGPDVRIRWDGGRLMYGGIRIKRDGAARG